MQERVREIGVFAVKICGITNDDDAQVAVAAGADAIGLNFYRPSPRFVSVARARSIARAIPPTVAAVGVFVNMPAADIVRMSTEVGLQFAQLHGDEPPVVLSQLDPVRVIRAFRLGNEGTEPIFRYLDDCRQLDCLPTAVLIDAFRCGQFGGTGTTVDWKLLSEATAPLGEIPLVLAGGLTPENVAEAIEIVRPDAVDTASGVEELPGRKDAARVEQFVTAAIRALRCR